MVSFGQKKKKKKKKKKKQNIYLVYSVPLKQSINQSVCQIFNVAGQLSHIGATPPLMPAPINYI